MTSHAYTEQDVGDFFDATTQTYLSFWDSEGVLHTGYFADAGDEDYRAAATRTSDILAAEAGIGSQSRVLDVGCGCGNFLIHLARRYGCTGEGIDLSGERVKVATANLAAADGGRLPVRFRQGSATALPYANATFSHVVSQDALFLVPDKPRSHAEIYRVLAPGGVFALSDFLQPRRDVSARARQHVYDRVRWSSGYSLTEYQAALERAGFDVTTARSADDHLKQTYRVLGRAATQRADRAPSDAARDWMLAFAQSCVAIGEAIDDGEFGWGIFIARKPGGTGH
jgi:ubiquinone/menaquinone biosynthesis C-methylase UbiE